ncbi:hypothetical protein COLU111180_08510 [Cohnella lubricantis]|uniref:Hsp20/alpha crystallin family protein n=1 Tax=Cohnella lubricantis TaxID=2163172 RepID=A0A841T6C0_9BACL|nr:hypothetical protein [Cohnella lubricantis]MBB6676432.1 hypothetical protein [Cohnella lubricantis]MBP2117561.1 hypothetical protein [Cohnella lubricantis]
MPSFFNNGSLPDFKELKNWFGPDFPWKLAEQMTKQRDGSWLNQFIRTMFDNSDQPAKPSGRGKRLQTSTAKGGSHLTVTIVLPPHVTQRDLRLFAAADRLTISGLSLERKQFVSFPCLVVPESGRAYRREGRIIVRFRRRKANRREVELFIPT